MSRREFAVRAAVIAGLAGVWATFGGGHWLWTSLALAVMAAAIPFQSRIERKGGRGPMLAGGFALLDSCMTGVVLGTMGMLQAGAFLLVLSPLWAVTRYAAPSTLLIPGVVGVLAGASSLFTSQGFDQSFYQPAAAFAMILMAASGGLVPKRRIIPLANQVDPGILVEQEDDILVLREAYRSLRDHYYKKERSARVGTIAKKMLEAAFSGQAWSEIAKSLQEELGLKGVRIYAAGHSGSRLVWRAGSGPMPDSPSGGRSLSTSGGSGALQERVDTLLNAIKQDEPEVITVTQVIRDQGRVCGLIVMDADSEAKLKEAEDRLQPALSLIGRTISHIAKRTDETRRVKESEILYSVVSLAKGAASQEVLAERILRELTEVIPADRMCIVRLKAGKAVTLAQEGAGPEPINLYSFAYGSGWQGWLKTSGPELHLLDPLEDTRVDSEAAFKSRIRSVCHLPLFADDEIIGWISASSARSGALDESHLTTLRIVASEAGPALAAAATAKGLVGTGLASPKEFVKALQTLTDGAVVAVEVPALEDLRHRFGSAPLSQALNRASRMLCAKAPPGSLVCRRAEGDFLVLIRGAAAASAQSWANEVTASAAMITLSSPDGSQRLSLALRAKVVESAAEEAIPPRAKKMKVPA